MPIILTDENFEKEIQKTEKVALVDFYATWCDPCSMIAPVLEKMEKEFEEKLVLFKANVDDNSLGAQKFKVDRIPMVVMLRKGQQIGVFTGFKPEAELRKWIEETMQ